MHHVYIIECKDGSFYCGITFNIFKRIQEHNNGVGAIFTKNRRPVKLVYTETLQNKFQAAKREKEIKGWCRKKKHRLIQKYIENKSLH